MRVINLSTVKVNGVEIRFSSACIEVIEFNGFKEWSLVIHDYNKTTQFDNDYYKVIAKGSDGKEYSGEAIFNWDYAFSSDMGFKGSGRLHGYDG